MIKAFIFDFDGVIADTESLWFETLWDFAQKENLGLSHAEMLTHVGDGDTLMMKIMAERLGGRDVLDQKRPELRRAFADKNAGLGTRDGLLKYFDYADEHDIKLACASSSFRPYIEEWLGRLDLTDRFACVVTRHEVAAGMVKPNPDIYLKALECLGLDATEAVAFEDSAVGCAAAEAAGITCVLVPNRVTEALTAGFPNLKLDMAKTQPAELLAALNETYNGREEKQ